MARRYAVEHDFTCGQWSYREGEVLSEDDLAVRGMSEDQLAHFKRRGGIREMTDAAPEAEAPAPAAADDDPTY